MVQAGIEAINIFGGSACLDVMKLVEHRGLDPDRFSNLLMKHKSMAMPYEDAVTFAVNAAKPIVDRLSPEEKGRIELLVTCTESGVDFGKSLSTYVHDYLGLNRNCRLFEIKQACYAGTAGYQMALSFILSQASPGAKALVIATDVSRHMVVEGGDVLTEDWSYAEPSSGSGAAALLISDQPKVYRADIGACGYYGYEVMDTCRPVPDGEAGNSDLSLLSYLDCCENSFLEYRKRVPEADYADTFQYLAFHAPFGGMVKGAHRSMMRKMCGAKPPEIEADFLQRVWPGLRQCQRVGNIMGGTVFISLASTIAHGDFSQPRRIGSFSYGSGCCSEFHSGVVTSEGQDIVRGFEVDRQLDERYELSVDEYDRILAGNHAVRFGIRHTTVDPGFISGAYDTLRRNRHLVLKKIDHYHREYAWA
jgi:polyketide biosynthesis 3-hydroxy-3-methylglutaryl-CoA synthase-like enzyme PksG